MKITQIRNATLIVEYENTKFLIDPWLMPKDYMPGFDMALNSNIRQPRVELPFEIEVSIDSLVEGELVYSVVIDQPKVPMKNIKALVVHDAKTTDIFPSVGIFDTPLNLIPNEVDQEKKNVKGIALVGYIETDKSVGAFHMNVRVLVSYEDEEGNRHQLYSYHKI